MKKIFGSKKSRLIAILVVIVAVVLFLRNFDVVNFVKSINPKKGEFIKVGKISFPRFNHESILLDDGTVLIFGGQTEAYGDKAFGENSNSSILDIQTYNPKTKKFTTIGKFTDYRYDYSVTKLSDGKILIAGGRSQNKSLKSTLIFEPKSGKLEKGPDMNFSRINHQATLLANGRVLISGGEYLDLMRKKLPLAWNIEQSEIYDPKTNKFIIAPRLNTSRIKHSAILLKDGRILIIGGVGIAPQFNLLSSIEIYNPNTNKFESAGNMNIARKLPKVFVLKNGNILITSGFGNRDKNKGVNSVFVREFEMYYPKTKESKIIAKRISEPDMPIEVLLNDDKILFTGGSTGVGLSLVWYRSSEIFDPATNEFIKGKDMNFRREGHRATLLKDGNVLITGSTGTGRTAELYISK